MRSTSTSSLLLGCVLLVSACASRPAPEATSTAPVEEPQPAPPGAPRELFSEWRSCSAWSFEERVLALELQPWSDAALAELQAALGSQDLLSVRAAVLLARGGEESREVLLLRLEERVMGPARESDAGDVVAAAALDRWTDSDTSARLVELSVGDRPHPDLEVRVVCAAAALDAGQTVVVEFLLRVLHAGTPAELDDPIDWTPTETLAWAKGRAAAALARSAGVPDRFQADGPFQAQIEVADDLRKRLAQP